VPGPPSTHHLQSEVLYGAYQHHIVTFDALTGFYASRAEAAAVFRRFVRNSSSSVIR
jgi:hypothetical protein